MPPPVGPTETEDAEKFELEVELNGQDWKSAGASLALALLKLDEVDAATVEKSGLIVLVPAKGKELDEKRVKKLVKEAGFKFKALKEPADEKEPEKEPEEGLKKHPVALD